MTIVRFTLGSILGASAVFCQPKDVQGWDKIKWGMSVAEVRAAYGSRASEPLGLKQRMLAHYRARGYAEDSREIQRVQEMPESAPNLKLAIKDIHIGDLTASAEIHTAENSDAVVRVIINATAPGATGLQRQQIFRTLKPLLIQKYGAPSSEERKPDVDGRFLENTLLWVFPSTSVTLEWSESTNPRHDNGWVSIEYKATDKKAVDTL